MDFGRFGSREVANITFRPLSPVDIGDQHFDAMQPCLFMDTAKASNFETTSSTVYAQGGQGNPKLIGWDGDKNTTITFTDALLNSISLAMLSGANVVTENILESGAILTHMQYDGLVEDNNGTVKIPKSALRGGEIVIDDPKQAAYAYVLDSVGGVAHFIPGIAAIKKVVETGDYVYSAGANCDHGDYKLSKNDIVRIDFYVKIPGTIEYQVTPNNFAGFYYIEADTLFRDEETGQDFPATFVVPRGKIQTNFTFNMSPDGDPSTFDFVVDAMPGYVRGRAVASGQQAEKVLFAIQVQPPEVNTAHDWKLESVHGHENAYPKGSSSDAIDLEFFDENGLAISAENEGKTAAYSSKKKTSSI